MTDPDEKPLEAWLRLARQHAYRTDAERADMAARLHQVQAQLEYVHAREARLHAESVHTQAALAQVRKLCDMTIHGSVRVQAVEQAQDTLTLIDQCMDGQKALPGDEAWGSVWLHGNWRYLTSKMSTPEREHAADAVARWSLALEAVDGAGREGEPEGLRWWREAGR